MAMTLRLSDEQTEALRARAEKEGRSMQQLALHALDDYLSRAADDELTDRLAERGSRRTCSARRTASSSTPPTTLRTRWSWPWRRARSLTSAQSPSGSARSRAESR